MVRMKWMVAMLLLAALVLSACQPVVAEPATQQADDAAMGVVNQFFEAWNTVDKEKMMALLTDDAAWIWLDSAKNFPVFLPEGKYAGEGKEEVGAMFDNNPTQWGYSGYPIWSEVQENQVVATEVWQGANEREVDVPLIAKSTYTIRDGKLAAWVWDVSPESSNRITFTPNTLEANRQLMTTINDEIWNQGNLDLLDEHYASDYVRHEAGYPVELTGPAGLKQFIQNLRAGFPDWNCTTADIMAAGDKVTVRYLCTGTHTGEWNGLPPTGKPIQFQSIIVHRIADGKVAEDLVGIRLAGLDAAASALNWCRHSRVAANVVYRIEPGE